MNRHILFAGLVTVAASLLPVSEARADHCCCNGGYSIGGYLAPTARVYSGATYYAPQSYYYSPGYSSYSYPSYSYGFGGYPSYGYGYSSYPSYYYGRPGFSISIGSGFGRSYYGSPFGYGRSYGYGGFGSRSGIGFSFGSGFGGHRHHHHH